MGTYKTSYFIPDSSHPGGILNLETRPVQGKTIHIGDHRYRIREVIELMPPQGEFHYLHVTCSLLPEKD